MSRFIQGLSLIPADEQSTKPRAANAAQNQKHSSSYFQGLRSLVLVENREESDGQWKALQSSAGTLCL